MINVRPAIRGIEHKELVWASKWPKFARSAVPVNADELCDTLVMRYKFTWLERLQVLFGQHLFLWFATNDQPPQWPVPYLTDPVHVVVQFSQEDAMPKTFPADPKACLAEMEALNQSGESVPNPHSDMNMIRPDIEGELRLTVRQKINERAAELSAMQRGNEP